MMGGIGYIRGSGGKHYVFNSGSTPGFQMNAGRGASSSHSGGGIVTGDDGSISFFGGDVGGAGVNNDQAYTPNK